MNKLEKMEVEYQQNKSCSNFVDQIYLKYKATRSKRLIIISVKV